MRKITHFRQLVWAGLFGLGHAIALGGCSSAAQQVKATAHEESMLNQAARYYWEGVRWGNGADSAAFIEKEEHRLRYQKWLADEYETARLVDAEVLQIEMGDENMDAPDGHTRTATVHLRTEGYTLPAQIVKEDTVTQEWYRNIHGWWVVWTPPEDEAATEPETPMLDGPVDP